MAFTVQDDTGTVADANSYITVAYLRAYNLDRGRDDSGSTDTEVEQALVKATSYLDRRFSFVGRKLAGRDQTTEWPRANAYDSDGYYISDLPTEVQDACAEYGFRLLSTASLYSDPTQDATGRTVLSKSEKVGPIEESATYTRTYQQPEYPEADQILFRAGLVHSSLCMMSVRG